MKFYKALNQQEFTSDGFSIVPIRREDRYKIMQWRNEQMYHLRQSASLTEQQQDTYFDSVISKTFEQDQPAQILFSYLEGGECIGYGGLVHINWPDRNAEISFIMETELENDHFETHWTHFLNLLETVAWQEVKLHKIYTYAFDIRPRLYPVLKKAGFGLDAELKEHCFFEGKLLDVIIHAKFNKEKEIRKAQVRDFQVTYQWATDPNVRRFSFNKDEITLKEHANWFFSTLEDANTEYYLLEVNGKEAGSVRFDLENEQTAKINYLLDPYFTGKGLGTYLLENGIKFLQDNRPSVETVYGYVLKKNVASVRIFEKLSFNEVSENSSELKFEKTIK